MRFRHRNRIIGVFLSILFIGALPAQERVQETRLLKSRPEQRWTGVSLGSLGSRLFAYSRYDEASERRKLYRLEGRKKS